MFLVSRGLDPIANQIEEVINTLDPIVNPTYLIDRGDQLTQKDIDFPRSDQNVVP